jgi:hypothetical protein
MLRILLIAATLCFSLQSFAQKYRTAAGIRLGNSFGLTAKQKIGKQTTLEGIFQVPLRATDDAKLTLLYEQHRKLIGKRLNFYYGAGVHKGWAASKDDPDPSGISLIAGAEISLGRLALSADYKPTINAISGVRFYESESAISLRYIFVKPKKKKINWKFWKKKDDKKKKKKRG